MATTRVGERERFVRDFWKQHGVHADGAARGPFRVRLPSTLKRRLRATELACVFRAEDLDDHPGGELMVPGNAVFDRILAMARGFGAVSRRYLRVRNDLDPDDVIAQQVSGNGTHITARLGEARYQSNFLFTFRVSYRSVETLDEIHSISMSGLTGHYVSGDDFFRGLNLMEAPAAGVADPASVSARDVLGGALEELERQIEATVIRFVRDSELHLQRERARLQTFFTALIAEEKSRLTRRPRTPNSVGAAERKLEWVNRLEQDNRLFAPRVEVALIGLQEMRTPARPVEFVRAGKPLLEAELDLATGELVGLPCATCSTDLDQIQLCPGEHLACAECMEECAECAC